MNKCPRCKREDEAVKIVWQNGYPVLCLCEKCGKEIRGVS